MIKRNAPIETVSNAWGEVSSHELNRRRVNTESQAGGRRPIREYMSQMTIAYIAHHLYPGHSVGGIFFIFDNVIFDWLREAWPSCPGFKFLSGIEKRRSAATAGIQARFMSFAVLTRKWTFCAFFPGNMEFLRCKLFLPFLIRFLDSPVRSRIIFRVV